MNKKALYSILSAIVLMIVASISLVLAVGHNASAAHDGDEIILSGWDYISQYRGDADGCMSQLGEELYNQYSKIHFEFPYGLVSMNLGRFCSRYSKVVSIFIPETIRDIKNMTYGFDGPGNVFTGIITVDPNNETYTSRDEFGHEINGIIEKSSNSLIFGFYNTIIPESVKKIEESAFAFNPNLTSIVIPDTVIEMGEFVFDPCENLTTIYCEAAEKPDGWSDDWNGTSVYDEEQGEYVDALIHTVWDCNKTITFDVNGGNQTIDNQTVCVDSLVTKPANPEKAGYVFKGWFYENGDEYDFTAPVTEDMTLTAKWEAVQAQLEPTEPETPAEENSTEVNNQNNAGLIWGIAGTSAGVLIIAGIVVGIVIAKRRRK